jgi:prefoldin subunit 5
VSIYKLYSPGTGGVQNSVASFDVQLDGHIVAMHMSQMGDLDADLDYIAAEISFLSSNTFAVNDARGSLMITQAQVSGAAFGVQAVNDTVSGVRVPVSAGERIHLHLDATSGTTQTLQAHIYVEDGADPTQRRR